MAGLFALNGVLCLAAMAVVKYLVPEPPEQPRRPGGGEASLRQGLLDPELLRVNAGIFILHIVLYAMFVVVPPLLVRAGLPLAEHWKLYLPVVLVSFVFMIPAIVYADRRNRSKTVLVGAVALLAAAELLFGVVEAGVGVFAALMLAFFIAFNVLEALLPSLVSRLAPREARGVAIGVYNTTQTLGVFAGGLLGGWVATYHGTAAVFGVCASLVVLWLLFALGMRPVPAVNETPRTAL
jgi:predicted MFS family arabinose efflux permease